MRTPAEIASWLWTQHQARARFQSVASLLRTDDTAEAYAVQDELVNLMTAFAGPTRGYKIGLTSIRMQQMCGIDQPIAGRILAQRIHRHDCRIESAHYVRLGVESELCVVLKNDLPLRQGAYTLEEIAAAVGGVAAAFELVDDRDADYRALDARSLIADNSWNAGVVVGEILPPIDLSALDGALHVNGQLVDRGNSRDALSHPLAVVQWLSDHLRARGCHLRAGDLVMTGSIVPTRFATAGEHYRFELAGLPPVQLRIT